jgi:Protochlamydia outer membrane protein
MKSLLSLLALLTLTCSTFLNAGGCGYGDEGSIAVGYSYRQDSICYEIKDINGITTSQDFDCLKIHQITARGYFTFNNIYFRGLADSGWIFGGTTTKKDVFGSIDLFEEVGNAEDCVVFDLSAAVGYQFDCGCAGFKFIPVFGYSWSHQNLETSHLTIVSDFIYDLDKGFKIDGFKENYKLNWYGPWIGLDLIYDDYCGWDLFTSFEYHWAEFNGDYRTNNVLLEDVIFERLQRDENGCGQGFVGTAGIKFDLCCNCTGFVMGTYQAWNLHNGCGKDQDDDLFEFNKLDWKTWHVTVGIASFF